MTVSVQEQLRTALKEIEKESARFLEKKYKKPDDAKSLAEVIAEYLDATHTDKKDRQVLVSQDERKVELADSKKSNSVEVNDISWNIKTGIYTIEKAAELITGDTLDQILSDLNENLNEEEQEVTLKIDVDGGKPKDEEEEEEEEEDGDDEEEGAPDDDDSHMQHHKSLEKRVDRLEDAWAEFMKITLAAKGDEGAEEELTEKVNLKLQLFGDADGIKAAVESMEWADGTKAVLSEDLSLQLQMGKDSVKAAKMNVLESLMPHIRSSKSSWEEMSEMEIVVFDDGGNAIEVVQIPGTVQDNSIEVAADSEVVVAENPVEVDVAGDPVNDDPEVVIDIEAALSDEEDEADDFVEPNGDNEVEIDVEVEDDDIVDVEVEGETMTIETNENYTVRNKKSKAPVGKMHKTEAEAKDYLDGLENKSELEVVSKEDFEKDFKETKDETHSPEEIDEGVAAILSFGDDTNPEYKAMLMKILGKDVEDAASKLDNLGK